MLREASTGTGLTGLHYVSGEGPSPCPIALFGEGPGATEECLGRPFCGRSGQLLDQILWRVFRERDKLYVSNVRKIRCVDKHGNDRPPTDAEVAEHLPTLVAELHQVQPQLVIACGAVAARHLLHPDWRDYPMDAIHGVVWPGRKDLGWDYKVLPIFHPAAGLRSPEMMGKFGWGLAQARGVEVNTNGFLRHTYPGMTLYHAQPRVLLMPGTWVAADTEGTLDDPICWSLASESGETHVDPGKVAGWENVRVVLHHALWDIPILEKMGRAVDWGRVDDTMELAYLLQVEPQGLKPLTARHLLHKLKTYDEVVAPHTARLRWDHVHNLAKGQDKKHWAVRACKDRDKGKTVDLETRAKKAGVELPVATLRDVPDSERVPYSGGDAWATAQLYPILWAKAREMGLQEAYHIDMGALPMIDRMQRIGIQVDRKRLLNLQKALERNIKETLGQLRGYAGSTFNPAATAQVRELLFQKLELMPGRKTPTGEDSTDEKVLSALKGKHKVVDLLLDWREATKTLSTFVLPLFGLLDSEGRVHPRFKYTRVVSSRYAMEEPNLLAYPAHSMWGKRVRRCFVAGKGRTLLSLDLNQIELRIGANESQDPVMLDVYKTDGDIHATTLEKLHLSQRPVAKRINFGVLYGLTSHGLQVQLALDGIQMTEAECQQVIDGWFETYAGVRSYLKSKARECMRRGFVRSPRGHIRYLPAIWAKDEYLRAEAARQAGNFPIQAGAAEEMKLGMARAWAQWEMLEEWAHAQPLLQIHDDLLVECDDDRDSVELVKQEVGEALCAAGLGVPVKVGIKQGGSWGELE